MDYITCNISYAQYPYIRLRYFWKKCENDIRFEKAERFVNSIRRFSTATTQATDEINDEQVKTKKRSFGKKTLGRLVISNWTKVSFTYRSNVGI